MIFYFVERKAAESPLLPAQCYLEIRPEWEDQDHENSLRAVGKTYFQSEHHLRSGVFRDSP